MDLSIRKLFTWQNLVIFLIILFCIRYIPLETRGGPSVVKTSVSFFCLILLIIHPPRLSKAVMMVVVYYLLVLLVSCLHPQSFRWSTLLYLLSFLIVFVTYYNLVVCEQYLSYEVFLAVIKGLMYAYTIVLVMQQILLLLGIQYFPLLNLVQLLNRGIGANSLGGEPSSAARIMAVLFLSMLRLLQLKYGRTLTFKEVLLEAKWPTIGFLWTMITMMSGTAFVGLAILSVYFLQRRYIGLGVFVVILFLLVVPYIEFTPLQRAFRIISAFLLTGADADAVTEADGSGASRAILLINTLKLDFFDFETWFGHGIDYTMGFGGHHARLKVAVIGGINEYGFLSFIVMQIIVYTCIIKRFFSLETVLWIFLFGMSFGNIAYTWGAVLLFTGVRYFQVQHEKGLLEYSKEEENNE